NSFQFLTSNLKRPAPGLSYENSHKNHGTNPVPIERVSILSILICVLRLNTLWFLSYWFQWLGLFLIKKIDFGHLALAFPQNSVYSMVAYNEFVRNKHYKPLSCQKVI